MTQNISQNYLQTFDWDNASWEEIMSLVADANKIIDEEGRKPVTSIITEYVQLCNKFENVKIAVGRADLERSRKELRTFFEAYLTDYLSSWNTADLQPRDEPYNGREPYSSQTL